MTTTLQQIQDRAVAFSSANGLSSLVADPSEIITRIAGYERGVFDLAADTNRYFFAIRVAVSSTGGSSERSIDVDALAIPCSRILKFKLLDTRDVNQVDLQDLEAELAPRYYMLGKKIYEVASDWSSTAGAVSGYLTYVRQAADLNAAGALTQTLSIDDDFTDLIELRLAEYLAHKDVGRDPAELVRLAKWIEDADKGFISHITQFGGVEARRFNTPERGDKK